MGFMVPVAERFAAYRVETDNGTETVPVDVCGELDESDPCFAGEAKIVHETPENVARLRDYIEGGKVYGIERVSGWWSRLSASGYLDCTEWSGPFRSEDEALDACKAFYEVDDDGDADDGTDESAGAP